MLREKWPLAVLAAAIAGGIAYPFTWDGAAPDQVSLAVKGSGVGLLAVYAAIRARALDGWLLALVMLMGMLGDVLLNAAGLVTGAIAFLVGHVIAIILYRRNARGPWTARTGLAVAAFMGVTIFAAVSLPRALDPAIGLYTAALALMAATAWLSRFPRALTGVGALLFVVSDLLIFAQEGPLAGVYAARLGVWGLYFTGQLMICLGVVRTLARED